MKSTEYQELLILKVIIVKDTPWCMRRAKCLTKNVNKTDLIPCDAAELKILADHIFK